MQTTSSIFMVRPVKFEFNQETAHSNAFQRRLPGYLNVQDAAVQEFDNFAEILKSNDIDVVVFEDTPEPHTPDSIFPNNWISTHEDGSVYLYPMEAENRRYERSTDLIRALGSRFLIKELRDLSYFEDQNRYLEGTGSMALDRDNKISYACLSPRTDTVVLKKFAELSGYSIVCFHALDNHSQAIYHTNVMMCVGAKFILLCMEAIKDKDEKNMLIKKIHSTGKQIIEITLAQVLKFAGNMLQLKNRKNEDLIVLSEQAFQALNDKQIDQLSKYGRLVHIPLNTIETAGGGSARCMIAEIHLPNL